MSLFYFLAVSHCLANLPYYISLSSWEGPLFLFCFCFFFFLNRVPYSIQYRPYSHIFSWSEYIRSMLYFCCSRKVKRLKCCFWLLFKSLSLLESLSALDLIRIRLSAIKNQIDRQCWQYTARYRCLPLYAKQRSKISVENKLNAGHPRKKDQWTSSISVYKLAFCQWCGFGSWASRIRNSPSASKLLLTRNLYRYHSHKYFSKWSNSA